jgi:uncharacterized protein (DUF58 family)
MSRSLLLGLLLIFLLVGGLATLNALWLALAIPLAVYLLAGFLFTPEKIDLVVERVLSLERATPGQPVTVTLSITNHGAALSQLRLRDPLPPFVTLAEGQATRLLNLQHSETVEWQYTFTGKRGYHRFESVEAFASDLFGVAALGQSIPTPGQMLILPHVPRLRRIVIRPRVTRVYAGAIPARQGGTGTDFFGVREYQPGLPLHAINWHASARHPEALFANEYEQERVADIGIILDARLRSNDLGGGRSIFEHSVIAAAALADSFLTAGNRVGLLVYGLYINWTTPGYGKRQRENILHALAHATVAESQIFSSIYISRRLFPPSSQLVFISPLVPDDVEPLVAFRAVDYPMLVICPNAVRYEAAQLPDQPHFRQAARILALQRYATLQCLRHAGIQVVDWDVAQPFDQAVESLLSRPPAFIRAIGAGGRV